MTQVVKFVIVEPVGFYGKEAAIRGLSFDTREQAEAHLATQFNSYRRDRAHVASRKVKLDPLQDAMTCQCCERKIYAKLGSIAHHGYERPGQGWQTASCFGAKRLPWEVDRSALGDLIHHLALLVVRHKIELADVEAERIEVSFISQPYNRQTHKYFTHTTSFSRETFAAVLAENEHDVFSRYGEHTFDVYKARDITERKDRIQRITRSLREHERRYSHWRQTHIWANDAWVKLDPTSINNGD